MKAFILKDRRKAEIGQIDLPALKNDEVLIKVKAAGLCGTDCHIYLGEYFSSFPIVPGHEFSGVVEAVGDCVSQVKAGERVTSDPNIFCERCYYCQQNLQNHCENFEGTGVTRNGAFAEYVIVPESTVFPIGNIDYIHAAMIEPLSCVVYGQSRAKPGIGQHVLIFGAGAIGQLHLQLAKHNGAASVTVVDLNPSRLELARKLGADNVVLANSELGNTLKTINHRGFQLVIDATGVPKVVEDAVKYVRNDGTLLIFGVCPENSSININPYEIFKRDLKIVGSFAIKKTFRQAIALIENGLIDVSHLIGDIIMLEDLQEAIEKMIAGKTNMKVIVADEWHHH